MKQKRESTLWCGCPQGIATNPGKPHFFKDACLEICQKCFVFLSESDLCFITWTSWTVPNHTNNLWNPCTKHVHVKLRTRRRNCQKVTEPHMWQHNYPSSNIVVVSSRSKCVPEARLFTFHLSPRTTLHLNLAALNKCSWSMSYSYLVNWGPSKERLPYCVTSTLPEERCSPMFSGKKPPQVTHSKAQHASSCYRALKVPWEFCSLFESQDIFDSLQRYRQFLQANDGLYTRFRFVFIWRCLFVSKNLAG